MRTTPELLARLTKDFMDASFGRDPTWPVHDPDPVVQAATLTQLMNPTTLASVRQRVSCPPIRMRSRCRNYCSWSAPEVWSNWRTKFRAMLRTARPMISSLRRNLQQSIWNG